jgi:hypothetical protein
MWPTDWIRFLQLPLRRAARTSRRGRRARLSLESLEERVLLTTDTWSNANGGNWSDAKNWSAGVPAPTDDVVISVQNAIVNIDVAATVHNLTINVNEFVTVDSSLTINGDFQWQDGSIDYGPGTINLASKTTTMEISGNQARTLDGVTLNNPGTVTWTGNAVITLSSQTVINNSGTWNIHGDGGFEQGDFGGGSFNNSGTLAVAAGSGTVDLTGSNANGPSFNNAGGKIDVTSGTLDLPTGTATGATFTVAAGAVVDFNDVWVAQTWTGTYTGSGGGTVEFTGGSLNAGTAGATLNFPAGMLQWLGSTNNPSIEGPGAFTNTGYLTISGNNARTLDGATLNNPGTVTWAGNAVITLSSKTVINNSGTWNIQGDGGFEQGDFGGGSFNNSGMLDVAAGSGTVDLTGGNANGPSFNNAGGKIDVTSGTLDLPTGTATGATFTVAAGAVVDFNDVWVAQTWTGTYTGSGGGTVEFTGSSLDAGSAGATLNFPAGMLQWLGSTNDPSIEGTGTFTNTGFLIISGNNARTLDGATLNNPGTVTWTGNAVITLSSGTVINNSGTWDIEGGGSFAQGDFGGGSFHNSGVLKVYDAAAKTLTITGGAATNTFTYQQATTQDAAGNLHTTFTITLNGNNASYPDTTLTQVVVSASGSGNTANISTNDTYTGNDGKRHETVEEAIIGAGGTGTLYRTDAAGNQSVFMTLSGFTHEYDYAGSADPGLIIGTAGTQNFFVSAGAYAYMNSGSAFYFIGGAKYVYGFSANTYDVAYHYDGSGASALVISGVAYSFMVGTDKGASFFNEAVGFQTNYGIAQHPGQDTAYFYDSPLNDVFVGHTGASYMYSDNSSGQYVEFDYTQGFALVYAYSFVGGTDDAYVYDTAVNQVAPYDPVHKTGWHRIV